MLIAQLSDPHITRPGELAYGVVDTASCLERAVAAVNALDPPPDFAILTGDLADHGAPDEYELLRALLAPLRMPVVAIPGNHDDREALRAAFAGGGYLPREGFLQFVVEDGPLRLVALDTLVSGEVGGALCAERLAWLDRTLAAAPRRPTMILMHHPPFATGIAAMDRIGLAQGGAALAGIVSRHPQVERIACGHVHRAITSRFGGTVAGTAPSTAHQIAIDFRPEAGVGFVLEAPGFQLHRWQEGQGLASHTAAIGDWPRLVREAAGKFRLA